MTTPLTNPGNNPNSQPNQSNFSDNQIYEINIDQVYNDYIKNIDNHRSYVNIIGQKTSQLLTAIGGNINAVTTNNLTPAKTFQESRCHCFFRLIGFPVVNANQSKFYNPGHDIIFGTRTIYLANKIDIANNPIDGFNALSDFREQYYLNYSKIFSTPTTVDAGALSLSGGANPLGKRVFNSPFLINQQPFDMVAKNQSYRSNNGSIVGNDNGFSLVLYQDVSGNFPASTTFPALKYHVIKPFIVDPRIDFTCSPTTRRVAVPFVPNASYLQLASKANVDPPILETIIQDRFTVNNQLQTTGDYTQAFTNFIQTISNNPDQSILGQINSNDIQQLSANAQFLSFVNNIQAMVKKLVAAQSTIAKAQGQYYWLPIPSTSGPEGGSTIQKVFLPTNISSQLVTPADGDILISTGKSLFSQTNQNAQASAATGTPDPGGFAAALKNSLGPSNSSSFVNNSVDTLDGLYAKRNGLLTDAGNALRTVEIIMGEFSGLGLCDMFAVLGALYTMPAQDLIGFLDTDALNRMNTAFNHTFTSPGIQTAMTSFINTVNQFYQLMEAIYQSELNTQGESV